MESLVLNNDTDDKEVSEAASLLETDVASNVQLTTIERRAMFPERLWECVNDVSDLLRWNPSGESVIVAEERFEKEVWFVTSFSRVVFHPWLVEEK